MRKIICCVAVIILFFSGMCLEDVKADSFFVYAQTGGYYALVLQEESVLAEVEAVSAENIGASNASFVHQIADQGIHTKRELRVSMEALLESDNELHLLSKFYMTASVLPFSEEYSHVTVLNYIHNIDGKKQV